MIRIMIVDDEKVALDELKFILSAYEDIHVIGAFTDPRKALETILITDVDVVFLDISMPEIDGFMIAQAILKLKNPPYIVFATAYDEYAINAFEINAVDYLLKPILENRLDSTIKRIREKMNDSDNNQKVVSQCIKNRYAEHHVSKIPLWKKDRIYLIEPKDITYCSCSGGETNIHTNNGDFITSDSLNYFESILAPYNFFRCHRSFLIHMDDIKEITPWFNNTYAVTLKNSKETIPISRRKSKEFKELLNL